MRVAALALGVLITAASTTSGQALARFLSNPAEPVTRFVASRLLEATNTRFEKHLVRIAGRSAMAMTHPAKW